MWSWCFVWLEVFCFVVLEDTGRHFFCPITGVYFKVTYGDLVKILDDIRGQVRGSCSWFKLSL